MVDRGQETVGDSRCRLGGSNDSATVVLVQLAFGKQRTCLKLVFFEAEQLVVVNNRPWMFTEKIVVEIA